MTVFVVEGGIVYNSRLLNTDSRYLTFVQMIFKTIRSRSDP